MDTSITQKVYLFNSVLETQYAFVAGRELKDLLDQLPAGKALLYDRTSQGNHLNFHIIEEHLPGARVRVGDKYLYLVMGKTDEKEFESMVSPIHINLLSRGIYYASENDILQYWKKPDDEFNKTEDYIKPVGRSKYLASIIGNHCGHIASAIEIGCNIGRNIHYLKTEMGLCVAGIEINEGAVQMQKEAYPELSGAKILVGDTKEMITELPDKAYDIVYSMAVLMHLHPTTSDSFWKEILRVAGKYILTIEMETHASERNWGRNYGQIFTRLGAEEIFSEVVTDIEGLEGYTTRVFKKA